MTDANEQNIETISSYVAKYKNEFVMGPRISLFCSICSCSDKSSQSKCTDLSYEFTMKIVKTFLAADITLYKLRNKSLQKLFDFMDFLFISESSARLQVSILYSEMLEEVRLELRNTMFFIIVDESEIKEKKYFNIMADTCESPNKGAIPNLELFLRLFEIQNFFYVYLKSRTF